MEFFILSILLPFIGIIYFAVKFNSLKREQEFDKAEKENEEFIKLENSMPDLELVATDESGAWHFSIKIKKDIAENELQLVYKRGYFIRKDGVTIPVCNLKSIEIKEVK